MATSLRPTTWEGLNHTLSFYRQPVIGLQGQPATWELLLRCSSHSAIQPLIEAYEAADLSEVVDSWVIHQAVDYLATSGDPGTYAINLSPLSFREPQVARELVEAVQDAGLDPSHLHLELTEHYVQPWNCKTKAALLYLKGQGFDLWLDDYGIGHSVADLTDRVQPAGIKIDGSLIRRLEDPRYLKIVADLIATAHQFGCEVCAEWVDSWGVVEQLRALGCDWAQGYLLGMPEPLPHN